METASKLLGRFLIWRVKHISQKQLTLILSFIIGISSGLAAVILKNTIHYTNQLLTEGFNLENQNFLYLAYPILGITLTVLFTRFIVKDNISHGITKILYAFSRKGGYLKPHNSYTSIIGSTFTIGFGGSVGAEAPIVLTGASIGSSLGRMFHLNQKTITLLVGSGAAGAIAGIFKAPITGLIFTLEVLMLDLTMASVIPLLISSVTATTIAYLFLGKGAEFTFHLQDQFLLNNLPWYLVLGVLGGLISLYMTWSSMFMEGRILKIKNPFLRLLTGGAILSFLIFLFPPLYGEGYTTISALLSGDADAILENTFFYNFRDNNLVILSFLVLLIVFKVIATAATNGSGGVGGIFAPTLFTGGVTGFFMARVLNLMDWVNLPEAHFSLAGMAALMAGVMHAPLTAIFLIAEITNGYALFIPLILTSTVSYLTIMYFEPHSIYTKRLAKKGELLTHHKDKAVLTLMRLNKVIETDFKSVKPQQTLGELVKIIAKARRNIFPVLNEDGKLLGIVLLDDIREIMFNNELYNNTKVENLMTIPPAFIEANENMDQVMRKFEETGAWNLPVVDNGKYLGFVSKSKIFSVYRRVLIHFSDE
ncbi:chloride channel protein [Thermophagus xiamenensis]|uniref:Chloride channel protein, CIC family n=1 Tax=Thermophagus xiamenensis TaxID=385682 RepID=A0A1I1W6A1_9BACT|nr:chloride channel protein [Thermophagus xiamenensis]SFD88520.1 chloride channel protein, CIC family [Thermophagus xiamenensis]